MTIPQAFTEPTFTHGNTRVKITQEQDILNPWAEWDQATGLASWYDARDVIPRKWNKNTAEWKPICGCFDNKDDIMLWAGESIERGEQFLVMGFNFVMDSIIQLHSKIEITSEQWDAFNRNDDDFDIDLVFGHIDGVIFINETTYRKIVNKDKHPVTQEDLMDIIREDFKTLKAYVAGNVYGYKVETNLPITRDQYYKILDVLNTQGKAPLGDDKYKQVCDIIGYDDWEGVDSCWCFYHEGTDEELYRDMASHWEDTGDIIEIKKQMGVIQ